jgi:hypothetical protein
MSAMAWAQSGNRPEILVLGTYHMANPGRDVYNMQADDVRSPKRQAEITELLAVLKKFHPTKIAVEADVGSDKTTQRYADYLAGKYTLVADETDQIAFRLAKELGHKTIYPVNEDGDFPLQRVINFAKASGRSQQFDAMMGNFGTMVKEQDDFLHSHTVLETLEYMNTDAASAKGVALYYASVPYGEPGDYAGPDLLAAWYQRNIRIYHNVVALIDSPSDRVLVIYGAGHLGWLQQDAANDASVTLRKLAEFTGAAGKP